MFYPLITGPFLKGLKTLTLALILVSAPHVPEALGHDVHVYRGVNANANSGIASTSPGQFSFTGIPAALSTFDSVDGAPVAKPCLFRFTVTGVAHDPAVAGDTGTIAGLPGYTATFDNDPEGHWSITMPGGVDALQARAEVSLFASNPANRVIVNGSQNNCQ